MREARQRVPIAQASDTCGGQNRGSRCIHSAHGIPCTDASSFFFRPSFLVLLYSLSFPLAKTRNCRYNKEKICCAESTRLEEYTAWAKQHGKCAAPKRCLNSSLRRTISESSPSARANFWAARFWCWTTPSTSRRTTCRSAFPMRSLKPPCAAARSPMRPARSSAKMRCSQPVGRTMSSWRIAPTGGVLRRSSAQACALAASSGEHSIKTDVCGGQRP